MNLFQKVLAKKLQQRRPILQHQEILSAQVAFDNGNVLERLGKLVVIGKSRNWTIGFGPAVIPPNNTASIQAQPRCLFRGEKIIDTSNNSSLYIQGLFIGQKSQFPSLSRPIPTSAFVFNSLSSGILLDTCDPASMITFTIQNASSVTATWSASIVGRAVL